MKKMLIMMLALAALTACKHETIDDRAAREARDYTLKNCPTPVNNYCRTDSMTFDRATRSLVYYYSLVDKADNEEVMRMNEKKMHEALLNGIISATNLKAYKDASISFRYVYRSASNPQKTLYETTFTKKDYGI